MTQYIIRRILLFVPTLLLATGLIFAVLRIIPGDVARLIADVGRARTLLGYEPKVSLSEGLERLLQWYQSQHKTPDELLEQEILHNWVPVSGAV